MASCLLPLVVDLLQVYLDSAVFVILVNMTKSEFESDLALFTEALLMLHLSILSSESHSGCLVEDEVEVNDVAHVVQQVPHHWVGAYLPPHFLHACLVVLDGLNI